MGHETPTPFHNGNFLLIPEFLGTISPTIPHNFPPNFPLITKTPSPSLTLFHPNSLHPHALPILLAAVPIFQRNKKEEYFYPSALTYPLMLLYLTHLVVHG